MLLKQFSCLILTILLFTCVGFGQEQVNKSVKKTTEATAEQQIMKSVEMQKEQTELTQIQADKVKSVPVSARRKEVILDQSKKTSMEQMHKINKAMRKSMMRHKHL